MVYADDVSMLDGIVNVLNRNTETLVVARKETGLYVNADNYMVMSLVQNAGRSYSIKTDNSSFETVEHFKYLGKPFKMKILFGKKLGAD